MFEFTGLTDIISIHSLRGEGASLRRRVLTRYQISIHALREEGDAGNNRTFWHSDDFYPRPPRGGRRKPEQP